MDLFIVTIPEKALAHQVDHSFMVIGESQQFITKKDGISVAMNVEVIDGKVVESLETLIG